MKNNPKRHSKLAPVFIASTVVFFLGSAYKFIFGEKRDQQTPPDTALEETKDPTAIENLDEDESEDHPKEPEEDPIQSL